MKTEQELIEEKKYLQNFLLSNIKLLHSSAKKNIENINDLSQCVGWISGAISEISLLNSVLEYEGDD